MRQPNPGWMLVAAGLTLLATVCAPAFSAGERTAGQRKADDTGTAAPGAPAKDDKTVETILREQEELLSGQKFSYDPAGRRDPFRSLIEEVGLKKKGPRPKGVGGMLVTEIDLVGIVQESSGRDVAFVIGSDNRGYFLRPGDEVYDGSVIAVDPRAGTVTFRQQVDDPRLIKPYRDVVKKLTPLEEEKVNE